MNVRPVEISTLEEQGLGARLGQRIDRTIDDVQLSRIPLPLAETAKRIEGGFCHFVVERHHDNPGILQQIFEKTTASSPRRANRTILVSRTATEEINKLSASSIAARKRGLSCSFAMVAMIADVSRTIRSATRDRDNPQFHPPDGDPERACGILVGRMNPSQRFGRQALAASHGTTVPRSHAQARFRYLRRSGGQAAARVGPLWQNGCSWAIDRIVRTTAIYRHWGPKSLWFRFPGPMLDTFSPGQTGRRDRHVDQQKRRTRARLFQNDLGTSRSSAHRHRRGQRRYHGRLGAGNRLRHLRLCSRSAGRWRG
jgi:hypothetical protein